jgi:serine/threonine-protein kinase
LVSVAPGSRLGSYEVAAMLGEGGMGQVYRARDSRLRRDVALKVLPALFVSDPDRRARFSREAQVLAALNHPNIAAIYGVEQSGDTIALAMELVEGDTLADRLAHGPIPLDEALPIARQIADALEAAHDQGIVHRDLKPANIKVRPDGTVKVLDFGLAKATDRASQAGGQDRAGGASRTDLQPASSDLEHSPTLTSPVGVTGVGMILGTAAYMSPEQARGRPVDRRADIWAFGCVLYEMLTGRRAFKSGDVSETVAAILRDELDWRQLPDEVPPVLRRFLMRCLAKDPKQRIASAGDLRLALDGAFEVSSDAVARRVPPRHRAMLVGMSALAIAATTVAAWLALRPAETPATTRLQVPLPPGQDFYFNGRQVVAIAPDGRRMAFSAGLGLWLRSLDRLEAEAVPGAQVEGRSPAFSPDGQSIVYYATGELKRVSVTGGAPVTLTTVVNPWGLTWGPDGFILYGQGPDGIWRIPGQGGSPTQIIQVAEGEMAHRPQLLPGGDWILYTLLPRGIGSWNRAQIVVQSPTTGERIVLIDGGRDARYLPDGYLVYGLNGTLLAVRFDARSRRVIGNAVPLVSNVFDAGTITGAVHFDIAANGSLIYVPRVDIALRLVWVDRNGHEQLISGEPRPYRHPRVSPDGARVAVEIEDPQNTDVWVGDSSRGVFTQLTRNDDVDTDPIWTPDSSHVVFTSVRGSEGLFMQAVDGGSSARRLTNAAGGVRALTWTADGKLGYEELAGSDLRILSLTDGSPSSSIKLFDDPRYFNERLPAISPDGRWVAYMSTESGTMEVYVRPFPDVSSGQWQISQGGGLAPLWSADGHEIFYRGATSLMAVQVRTAPSFKVMSSNALFNLAGYVLAGSRGIRYEVAKDGRFLLLKSATLGDAGSRQDIIVVEHWLEEVKRRVPTQ